MNTEKGMSANYLFEVIGKQTVEIKYYQQVIEELTQKIKALETASNPKE